MLLHTTFSDPYSSLLITVHTCVSLALDYQGAESTVTTLPSQRFSLILFPLTTSADLA